MMRNSFRYFNRSPEIIRLTVMMYIRYPLSLRQVDDFTRECVRLIADTSISGLRVARELDWAIVERARPAMIVSDNGTELTSMAILRWS